MARVTLYDGATGTPVAGDADSHPDPVVSADDHSAVAFALAPHTGRVLVQFVADPEGRRLVAGIDLEEGDDLPAIHRAIQRRLADSSFTMAPPGRAPPHLNVFHYLAAPDPAKPDTEIRAHVVATDDPVEVGVPSAAAAASVVAFFRERAPWKVVAVHSGVTDVSGADVRVAVDDEYDAVTYVDREESWTETEPVPRRGGADGATAQSSVSPTTPSGATGVGIQPAGMPSVLRIFDGASGELLYDAKDTATAPDAASERAKQRHAEGQAIVVDPAEGVVLASLVAPAAAADRRFFVEYNHHGNGDLVPSFLEELALRVDDLGVSFVVDVGDGTLDEDQLTAVSPSRPEALTGEDLAWIYRANRPVDFVAPDGETAFELASFLRQRAGSHWSLAVSSSGRTDTLDDVDVVVAVDPDVEAVEPVGATAAGLAEHRLERHAADLGAAIEAMVGRIDEITGSIAARQRIFAKAMSGQALARRGLTVAPVDDSPIGRRRWQAFYLALYGLLLAGLGGGWSLGLLDPFAAPLSQSFLVQVGPLPGTPFQEYQGLWAVEGYAMVGGCLAALLAGAYWIVWYPMGPFAAARELVKTVWRQVTGGVGSGTVPSSVRTAAADPIQDSLDDLATEHARLVAGGDVDVPERFDAFLAARLFERPLVPDVVVVSRPRRWGVLLLGIVVGFVAGTVAAAGLLAGLWVATTYIRQEPTLLVTGLVALVGLTLLASLVKGVAMRYGRGRPPRWSTAR